jgi:RNA polymerase sigma-70 factor (ECF subfamily)
LLRAERRSSAPPLHVVTSHNRPRPIVRGPIRRDDRGQSDADLMRRVAAGDTAALGGLYDRHHARVHHFLRRATGSASDAEDVTHEVFLVLTRAAAKYDGRSCAAPFLLGIAAQLVRQRRRRVARWVRTITMFGRTAQRELRVTPEDIATGAEQLRRFEEALSRLTEEKRLVFLLVEGEGMSGDEVSGVLGIPVKTVWTRLHYARAELGIAIDRYAKR